MKKHKKRRLAGTGVFSMRGPVQRKYAAKWARVPRGQGEKPSLPDCSQAEKKTFILCRKYDLPRRQGPGRCKHGRSGICPDVPRKSECRDDPPGVS